MTGKKVLIVTTGIFILTVTLLAYAEDLEWRCISKEIVDVRCVMLSSSNTRFIYIGTNNAVFKTSDAADSWRMVLKVKGENPGVNWIYEDNQGLIYAATQGGLFLTRNYAKSWERLFRGKNTEENDCQCMVILPGGEIYLGTRGGLFISKDKGRFWQKVSGNLKNLEIFSLAYDKENIYVAARDGLYKMKRNDDYYERIFTKRTSEQTEEADNEVEETSNKNGCLNYVVVDPNLLGNIYLATDYGVYRTKDFGQTWEAMTQFGLLNKEIKFLYISKSAYLYAISKSGIFVYKKDRWQELSLNLAVLDIRDVTTDKEENLYAATEKGLFKAVYQSESEADIKKSEFSFENELSVQQLHQAAIKYAGVIDPERIDKHRRLARLKAALPEVSIDYDKTISTYSNSSLTRFSVGPSDWGVSFKWNLSDLVWSEQQRLIDSQVRLMIQLRNDILDEVTKIYFQRCRLKTELSSEQLNSRKRNEKELRLQELTASLDALTGNYLSEYIRDRSMHH